LRGTSRLLDVEVTGAKGDPALRLHGGVPGPNPIHQALPSQEINLDAPTRADGLR